MHKVHVHKDVKATLYLYTQYPPYYLSIHFVALVKQNNNISHLNDQPFGRHIAYWFHAKPLRPFKIGFIFRFPRTCVSKTATEQRARALAHSLARAQSQPTIKTTFIIL